MIYLLGSILLTSYLALFFKVVGLLRLNSFQVIVFNYITCVITGCLVESAIPFTRKNFQAEWLPYALIMGALFIIVLVLIGSSTQRIGVAVTSVSYKLSLVIPFLFSIVLYNEQINALRWVGILLALLGVVLTCLPAPQKGQNPTQSNGRERFFLPALIFLGSGIIDTLIKFTEHRFLQNGNKNEFLITAFAAAALAGIVVLAYGTVVRKNKIEKKAVLAGIALGVPNYFSIWCLVQVLKLNPGNSSAILPINNMAIVLVTTLAAWFVFKEKLSLTNWVGVMVAIIAIFCITGY